jgi:hypothetical protein
MPTTTTDEYAMLRQALLYYGWDVKTYSPGDGVTRYRLVPAGTDYFESSDGPTVLGRAQAVAMMRGILHVLWRAETHGGGR